MRDDAYKYHQILQHESEITLFNLNLYTSIKEVYTCLLEQEGWNFFSEMKPKNLMLS
jgi:hypothetical protein